MDITISSPGSPGTSYTDNVKQMVVRFYDELEKNDNFDSLPDFKTHLQGCGYSNDYVRNILPFLQFCGIVQYGDMEVFENEKIFTNIGHAYIDCLKSIEIAKQEQESENQKAIIAVLEEIEKTIFFQCIVIMMKSSTCNYAIDYFDALRFVLKYDYIDITEYSLLIYERSQGMNNYIESMNSIVQDYRNGNIEIKIKSETRKENGKVNTFSYLNSILARAGVLYKDGKKYYIVESRRAEIECAIREVENVRI